MTDVARSRFRYALINLAVFALSSAATLGLLVAFAQADDPTGPKVEITAVDAGAADPSIAAETHLDGNGPQVAPPVATTTTITTTTTPAEADPVDSVRDVVAGARSGNWRMVVGAALALLMLGLKTARDKTKWFSGDRGGAILVLSLSLCGALGTSLATGLPVDLRMLVGVFGVAFTAAGGYSVIKSLFWPAKRAG